MAKRDAEEWDAAVTAFNHAGTYQNADVEAKATRYLEGEKKRSAQDWDGAVQAFSLAGDYEDAQVQVKETYYMQGVLLFENKQYQEAYSLLTENLDPDYKDTQSYSLESQYQIGRDFLDRFEYKKAAKIFINLNGYRDVHDLVRNNEYLWSSLCSMLINEQGEFYFGNYNGKPLRWYILKLQANKMYLISADIIENRQYNSTESYDPDFDPRNIHKGKPKVKFIYWENCDLRKWMNGEFWKNAFSKQQQNALIMISGSETPRTWHNWNQKEIFFKDKVTAPAFLGWGIPKEMLELFDGEWWSGSAGSYSSTAHDQYGNSVFLMLPTTQYCANTYVSSKGYTAIEIKGVRAAIQVDSSKISEDDLDINWKTNNYSGKMISADDPDSLKASADEAASQTAQINKMLKSIGKNIKPADAEKKYGGSEKQTPYYSERIGKKPNTTESIYCVDYLYNNLTDLDGRLIITRAISSQGKNEAELAESIEKAPIIRVEYIFNERFWNYECRQSIISSMIKLYGKKFQRNIKNECLYYSWNNCELIISSKAEIRIIITK